MKRLYALLPALAIWELTSCHHHGIDIRYSDSSRYYTMRAHFDRDKMEKLEKYLDDMFGDDHDMSFRHTRIDGDLSFDRHSHFYMKKSPGVLIIKVDKRNNSRESYHRIRHVCEGVKEIIIR